VQAREELGLLVVPVVDDGFVDAAEARAGVRRDVVDVERLQDVHHEVAARPIGGEHFDVDGGVGFAPRDWRPTRRLRRRRRLRRFGSHAARYESGGAGDGGTLQKVPAVDGMRAGHAISSESAAV
jgi:hypothetical protein